MDSSSQQDVKDRPVRLSLQLIVKRHLPDVAHSWNHEQIIESLNKITHLRLDRENIGEIDNLELLGSSVTNVYLQENSISVIQNLDCLQNLQFLVLSGNKISKLENLKQLSKLLFLDLSDNQIDHCDADELPSSLSILNLKGNPCCNQCGYRENVLERLPNLRQLDMEEIDDEGEEGSGASGDNKSESEDDIQDSSGPGSLPVPERGLRALHKNKLPDIDVCLQDLTTEILLRSQNRLEESMQVHRQHKLEMDSLQLKHHVKPS